MKLFSNEIVFRGHPDKVCDQIGDAILDAYLAGDRETRAGIEVTGGKGIIFITGEVTSNAEVDIEKVTKGVLKDIGYPTDMTIINNIGKQSNDIAQGVDIGGAGDQGLMVGYACNQTPEKLPIAMVILQKYSKMYTELRRTDKRFLPDGKCQITGVYDEDFNIKGVDTFVINYQVLEKDRTETDKIMKENAINLCKEYGLDIKRILINPTGKFEIGGFEGDAGVLGRKIVVDAYQGFAPVGGGAQSGKDGTKVDRSGAYKARQIAKRVLEANDALRWCEVQLSYAIGIEEPLAIYIESDKGNIEVDPGLYEECKPKNIIEEFKLQEPCFYKMAQFGHYGDCDF